MKVFRAQHVAISLTMPYIRLPKLHIRRHYHVMYVFRKVPDSKWRLLSYVLVLVGKTTKTVTNPNNN